MCSDYSSLMQSLMAATAGFHDGTRTTLFQEHLGEPDLAAHEQVHERIIVYTADGNIIAFLSRAASHPSASEEISSACTESMQLLVDQTRFAHEVFATYLGIQSLQAPLIPAAIRKLESTPEYLSYYNFTDSVISKFSNCTFLSWMIGWELAIATFSSTAFCRLAEHDFSSRFSYINEAPPQRRLEQITELLADDAYNRKLNQLLDKSQQDYEQSGHSKWDIRDEQSWISNVKSSSTMEKCISNNLRPWLKSIVKFDSISNEERERTADATIKHLSRQLGVQVGPSADSALSTAIKDSDPSDSMSECYWQGDARIRNSGAAQLVKEAPTLSLREIDRLSGIGNLAFCQDISKDSHDFLCTGVRVHDQKSVPLGRVRLPDLHNWIKLRAKTPSDRTKEIIAIVCHRSKFMEMAAISSACLGKDSDGKVTWSPDAQKIITYADGNWFDCLDALISPGSGVLLGRIVEQTLVGKNYSGGLGEDTGVVVHYARPQNVDQIKFFRIFNHVASVGVATLENRLRDLGHLSIINRANLQETASLLENAAVLVSSFWDEF